ncbi:hypothetical protein EVAR_96372_1 [Eumeta japonica]|uniref:Transposable element P transposase-like RNase H domain-containing protein n=1 Tax=Eumeta variegata TaxID=151549 RepID=A0A4C1T0H7_EUMVA|nr:hypothetical protein EVAR_96372_1 [Eumeta japonica]
MFLWPYHNGVQYSTITSSRSLIQCHEHSIISKGERKEEKIRRRCGVMRTYVRKEKRRASYEQKSINNFLLVRNHIVHSKKSLNKAVLNAGINDKIFSPLKTKLENMSDAAKYCILMFNEVSLSANLQYNEKRDKIIELVDTGVER